MKFIVVILKLMTATIVFMITSCVFMFCTASYLPRLFGANYYESGCFDGVTNVVLESKDKDIYNIEKLARNRCDDLTKRLREKGYLL